MVRYHISDMVRCHISDKVQYYRNMKQNIALSELLWYNIEQIVYKYCTNIVHILYKYCRNIVEILYKIRHCRVGAVVTARQLSLLRIHLSQILYKHCTNIAQIVNTYWTNNVQILYKCSANIVQLLSCDCQTTLPPSHSSVTKIYSAGALNQTH